MKCSLLRCDSYEYEKVYTAIAQTIQNLGGFEPYIQPGERVLLKANLLMKKKPEEAATTHPIVVKALAALLLEYGATVIIGDSPGGPFNPALMNGVYKATGMSKIVEELQGGVALNSNFKSFKKDNPEALIMKHLTLTDMLNDVDKVISVAKLKTHAMMTYTGAVKNMFGVVPGIVKVEYHMNISDYENFADMLIDVCIAANPVLSFIDGIVGMEGNGPSAGVPVNIGVIMGSASPHTLDLAAAHIIGLEAREVPTLKRAQERGLLGRLAEIDFVAEKPQNFVMPSFDIVRGKKPMNIQNSNLPNFAKAFLARHMQSRPVVNAGDCTGCAICKEACPVKVVHIVDKKAGMNYTDCIRCYCCQELCPQKAIRVHKPRLVKMLRL
ncbi:MAG: DUF362 domain-containing protein [Turicibacter sp.]|nr:DUF362 domain-containing protein [Turicibacter sp.]